MGSWEFLVDEDVRVIRSATIAMSGMPLESFIQYCANRCGVHIPNLTTKHQYLRAVISLEEISREDAVKWGRTHKL